MHDALAPFHRLIALAVVLVCAAGAVAQDEPAAVDLRPQWREGQRSRYEVWTRRVRDTTMSLAGQSRSAQVTMETTGEVTWVVDRVQPNGGATCTMTLDWLSMSIASDGERQVSDSRRGSGDNEMIHDLLRAMAGVPITVEVAPDGSIESVHGTDAIRRRLDVPEMMPQDLDFIESASDLATIPDAPATARVGARWDADYRWTHEMGHLRHDMSYTLAGVEELAGIPIATVTGRGSLSLDVDHSKLPEDAPPIDVKLVDGSVTSQVMFDLQRHEAIGRNTVQETTIDVTVRMPQQTLSQRTHETIQSQVLRIGEGGG